MKRIVESKEEVIGRENVYFWMNKYISLLEKYNELLVQQSYNEFGEENYSESSSRTLQPQAKRVKQNLHNEE